MAATATPEHFALTLDLMNKDSNVDAILVTMVTPPFVDCEGLARSISEASRKLTKPIIICVQTNENWAGTVATIRKAGIPVYNYPETAARALASMVRYGEMRKRLAEPPAQATGDKTRAAAILADSPTGFISQAAAYNLLARLRRLIAAELRKTGYPTLY